MISNNNSISYALAFSSTYLSSVSKMCRAEGHHPASFSWLCFVSHVFTPSLSVFPLSESPLPSWTSPPLLSFAACLILYRTTWCFLQHTPKASSSDVSLPCTTECVLQPQPSLSHSSLQKLQCYSPALWDECFPPIAVVRDWFSTLSTQLTFLSL